jgi:hypothetical protein
MESSIKHATFDCGDPRRLSTLWSEATGYVPLTVRRNLEMETYGLKRRCEA